MIQSSEQSGRSGSEQPCIIGSERQTSNRRLWLFWVGGSVLLHLLLIRWVGAIIGSHVNPATAMPVDLIQLPDSAGSNAEVLIRAHSPTATVQGGKSHSTEPLAAGISRQQAVESAHSQLVAATPTLSKPGWSQSERTPVRSLSPRISNQQVASQQFANVIPSTALSPDPPLSWPANRQPSSGLRPQASPLPAPSQPVLPTTSPLSPGSTPIPPPPVPTASVHSDSQPGQPFPGVSPVASPMIPLIASQRIAQPLPNLSEAPSQDEQREASSGTDQTLVPNYLTANLVATSPSVKPRNNEQIAEQGDVQGHVQSDDQVNDQTEQPARPQIQVQRFLTNSQLPPCAVTPEAVYFLGKTVAMRVITNTTGQVVQTVTEASSRNLAYDELATCLVRNWNFKPAIDRGQPVASDGLVVQITIDRN